MALEAAYRFDDLGSTTVVDLSGNGRDLDLSGSAGAQVAGLDVGALGKTGAAMPILPASVLAACQTDDRTIMFDALGNLGVWWVRFQDDGIDSGAWGVLNIGSMAVQARRASDDGLATRPLAPPPGAVRQNYCATYVRATGVISLYHEGALASTSSFAPGTALSTGAERIDLAEWSSTGPALDNLRLYSHALTASEVADIAGTPVEAPTTSNDATLALSAPVPTLALTAGLINTATLAVVLPVPTLVAYEVPSAGWPPSVSRSDSGPVARVSRDDLPPGVVVSGP